MKLCGVDEAGRGPVIGPLVVAAAAIKNEDLLNSMGLKDSKLLTSTRRKILDKEIRKHCDFALEIIDAQTVDSYVKNNELNKLSIIAFSSVIAKLKPTKAIVDSCDVNPARFAQNILNQLGNSVNVEIDSQHKADTLFPIVSAASILAKEAREKEMQSIREEIGDCGSGYPSDPKTIAFLSKQWKKSRSWSIHIRQEWKTIKRFNTSSLDDFG